MSFGMSLCNPCCLTSATSISRGRAGTFLRIRTSSNPPPRVPVTGYPSVCPGGRTECEFADPEDLA